MGVCHHPSGYFVQPDNSHGSLQPLYRSVFRRLVQSDVLREYAFSVLFWRADPLHKTGLAASRR